MSNRNKALVSLAVIVSAQAQHVFVSEFVFELKTAISSASKTNHHLLWSSGDRLRATLPNFCDTDGVQCRGRPDLLVVLLDSGPASMDLGIEICRQIQEQRQVLVLAPTEEHNASKYAYLSSLIDEHPDSLRLSFYTNQSDALAVLMRNLEIVRGTKNQEMPLFAQGCTDKLVLSG